MAEDQQQQQQQGAGQNVAAAANAVMDVAKAAGKAASGNVAGAVLDLLKNPQIRNAIIAITLAVVIIFVLIGMSVGSAITAAIQWFVDNWSENWAESWEEQGVNSRGNILYLFSIGALKTVDNTIAKTIEEAFETDSHRVDGAVADNSNIEGGNFDTDIDALDYEQTFASIQQQEALVGNDGALRKRLDLIKNRIQQRGSQLKVAALGQYSLETIGVTLAASVSNTLVNPFLYNGVDLMNSSINVDLSAFDVTDIQALKILAAFCVQHECDLTSADMWEIMDYCGWYGIFGFTNVSAFNSGSIYNTQQSATFMEEFLGFAQAGESLDPQIYELSDLQVPTWRGTCASQWYYEEIKQIKDYKKDYDLAVKNNNTELLQTMYPIPTTSDGNIDYSSFRKLNNYSTFGLIDLMYSCSYATLSISRSEYHGADEVIDEALTRLLDMLVEGYSGFEYEGWADMVNTLLAQWTKADSKPEIDENNLPSKDNGSYKLVLHNAGTPNPTAMIQYRKTDVGSYVIKNYHTGEYLQERHQYVERPDDYVYQSEHGLYVPYLAPDSYYQIYYCPCLEITPVDCGHHAGSEQPSHNGACFEKALELGHEHQYVCIDIFDTYFSETAELSEYQAYQLQLSIDISFAARSVDEIAVDILGLWPGDLRDTITDAANRSYAYGYMGNENLLSEWTDIFTDANGQKRTLTFERQYGYQYEYYMDYIQGVADELDLDTTGLFIPDNGYGDTMVSVARKEYQYASANHTYGGSRFWDLAELGSGTKVDEAQRNSSWSAAFVLGCAYQCGYVGSYGCFGNMGRGWPLRTSALWNKLVSEAGADLYETRDFAPQSGDLIFFAPHVGSPIPTYVGIVTTVHSNGDITVIAGDVNNKVAQTTYHGYKVGYPCKINNQDLMISSYVRPKYPNANITSPMYLSYSGTGNILTASPYVTSIAPAEPEGESVLLAGYPRFRINQLYKVMTVLRRDYPEYYSDELLAAVKSGDKEMIIRYWYDAFLSNDAQKVKEDQLTIASQLFVKPIVTRQLEENKFNWAATEVREEIMLLIISTSSNEIEINKVLKELTQDLTDAATDEELLVKFMTDNYLGTVLEAHQDGLWYGDPEYLRAEWLSAATSLLNALREKYIINVSLH